MRLLRYASRFGPRFFQSNYRRIRRLLRGKIFAGALPQFFRGLGHVENIVDDLEREAERATERSHGRELLRRGVRRHGSKTDGRRQQRRGFVFVDRANLGATDPASFRFQVRDLARDQLPASGGFADFAKNIAHVVARDRPRFGRDFKSNRQQRVARQDRDAVAENFVASRAAAAEIVVIHAGEIVVNERISVDAFHRTGVWQGGAGFSAAGFGGRETKNRPEAFAAGEQTVAHRLVDGRGRHRGLGQKSVEGAIDLFS